MTKKSPSQLDREIEEARIARSPSSAWDVAIDRILEGDPKRAAQIVEELRETFGATVNASPEFSRAVREAPEEVRQKFFALLEGLFEPPQKMNVVDKHGGFTIVDTKARTLLPRGAHDATLWRPGSATKGSLEGTLVAGSVRRDDFYQVHQPVVSALYKLPRYSYKVKVWWKLNGERLA